MRWRRFDREKPVIPDGQFGVGVIVAEFDPCYEECCPGRGLGVNRYYTWTTIPEISPNPHFYEPMDVKEGWIPACDKITHWMYEPDPPPYEVRRDNDGNVVEFVYLD